MSEIPQEPKRKYKKRKNKDEIVDQNSTGGDSFNDLNMKKRQLQMAQLQQLKQKNQLQK